MAGENVMTDYQFKSILKMATTIVRMADSKEEAIQELEELAKSKESSKE